MHSKVTVIDTSFIVLTFGQKQVTIEGEVEAVGQSYVPVEAYVFIHLTQVTINGHSGFNAIANQPRARAATDDGNQAGVSEVER